MVCPDCRIEADNKGCYSLCPKCKKKISNVEIFQRVVGYYRPVKQWNDAAKERFKDIKYFKINKIFSDKQK